MRIAIISDVHSNLEALRAVQKDILSKGIDKIYHLGDITSYGANPKECTEIIQGITENGVLGNHEHVTLRIRDKGIRSVVFFEKYMDVTDKSLTDSQFSYLRSIPPFLEITEPSVSIAHGFFDFRSGTDHELNANFYLSDSDFMLQMTRFFSRVCFVGHTHIPRAFCGGKGLVQNMTSIIMCEDEKWIINPGSVGQPRDNDPRASYGILEMFKNHYEFRLRRIPYDIKTAAKKILNAGIKEYHAQRLFLGE